MIGAYFLIGSPASAETYTTMLASEMVSVSGGTFNRATASCPSGMVVTGGGVDIGGTDPGNTGSDLTERYSGPSLGGTAWTLGMDNHSTTQRSFTVIAICVTGTTGS